MRQLMIAIMSTILLWGCEAEPWKTKDISGLMPVLDFNLVDENGKTVSGEDFFGKTSLLFFGFTHCPDICPTTLARLAALTNSPEGELRSDVQILFVSVDYKRDTPAILKQYTDAFSKQVIGLSGTKEALDTLTRRYRVTYALGDADESGNYEVSHSSAVFAFNRKGQVKLLIRDSDSDESIKEDLLRLLNEA